MEEFDPNWRPKRSKVPIIIAVVFLLAAAVAAYFLFFVKSPKADRILVVIATERSDGTWEAWWDDGEEASEQLAKGLNKLLEEHGMRVVKPDKEARERLKGLKSLDELRDAAVDMEAGFVLVGVIKTVNVQEVAHSDGYKDFSFEVQVQFVNNVDRAAAVDLNERPLRFFFQGKDEAKAMVEVTADMPPYLMSMLAHKMVGTPALEPLATTPVEELPKGDVKLAGTMKKMFALGRKHQLALEQRAEFGTVDEKKAADAEHGDAKPVRIGGHVEETYLVGRGPEDRILLSYNPRWVLVRPDQPKYELMRAHEQIVSANPDGKQRKLVFETYNFYSGRSVSADGNWVACIVDHHRNAKSLSLISVADGKKTDVLVDPNHYYSGPAVSPTGKRIAFYYSPFKGGGRNFQVIKADGTGQRTLVEDWNYMWPPRWAPDERTLYVAMKQNRRSTLWAFDTDTGAKTALLGPAAGAVAPLADDVGAGAAMPRVSNFKQFDLSRDGRFAIISEHAHDGQWIGRFDITSRTYKRLVKADSERIVISPEMAWVAFETPRTRDQDEDNPWDQEIALIPVEGGEPNVVTENAIDDQLLMWSRDGKRIYFSQRGHDPDSRRGTNRVYWVDI